MSTDIWVAVDDVLPAAAVQQSAGRGFAVHLQLHSVVDATVTGHIWLGARRHFSLVLFENLTFRAII